MNHKGLERQQERPNVQSPDTSTVGGVCELDVKMQYMEEV